jgi:predicted GIY-YIG superfamily endonuclease
MFYVYLLASRPKGTFYAGMTDDLLRQNPGTGFAARETKQGMAPRLENCLGRGK